jgi:hypothetical protein
MKSYALFAIISVATAASACGAKDKKPSTSVDQSDLRAELTVQATSEAINAASNGDVDGASGLGLALDLNAAGDPVKSLTRTCVQQSDGSALVTINSEIEMEKSNSGVKVSRTNRISGKMLETRLWKNSAGAVSCVNGERAQINWKGALSGYSLTVKVEQERQQTMSQTNSAKNTTISRSRSFNMVGERNVALVSYSEDSAAGVSIQEKSISGRVSRSFKFVDKNSQERSGLITSETVGAPLAIKVRRNLSTKQLISREIVSGVRASTSADGAKVELSFSNLLMSGEGESCEAQSGSFTAKYSDAAGALVKSVSCVADSGALSCTDDTGAAVEVESPSCDPMDGK